uniref:Multiple C2 domains, transmembrane 2a n=1 Tax=Cynoglossus semilaevis TaxID=244447 RepID=A0A3P8W7F5_CYNSE
MMLIITDLSLTLPLRMDAKKKNFLENFRLKTKLINLKRPGKKANNPKGKKLAYRRSISVPDLRVIPGHVAPSPTDSDRIYNGVSPQISDTDSVASGSLTDSITFSEKCNDVFLEIPRRGSKHYETTVDKFRAHEDRTDGQSRLTFLSSEHKFAIDPISDSRSRFKQGLPPRPVSLEIGPAGSPAAALAKAHSLASEQVDTPLSLKNKCFEQERPLFERQRSPRKENNVSSNTLGTPLESTDGTSLDSVCCSMSEERINLPSATDSEEHESEPFSPFLNEEFSTEEALQNLAQEEDLNEVAKMCGERFFLFEENGKEPENSSVVQAPAPVQRYLLNVTLKQGRNLVIRDKRSGSSDPYVKFKLEGKQFYKSKVVYKSLNPRWNESFSHPLRDREHIVDVRVYDKNRTSDEFMGSTSLALKNLDLYRTYEMELPLDDPKSKENYMGVIVVEVCLMFRDATIKRSPKWQQKKTKQNYAAPTERPAEMHKVKNQVWSGVFSITLVEGQDFPQYGHGDIYVCLCLGEQKCKSRNLCIQANPQWREQFDFNQFEDNQEPLQIEVFSKKGRKGDESWGMFEIDLSRLSLYENHLYTHVLDPGKGRLVFLVTVTPAWGVSVSDIELAPLERADEKDTIVKPLSFKNSHKCVREVGFLQIKVIKANDLPTTDLNGKSNPFCVVELGNCKLQTQTVYKSVNPVWSHAFTFPIKDINDVVELTVFDENGEKNPNFLGKVAIPLLSVQNGQELNLFLKKEDLGCVAKGTITIVLDVIYNKVRASITTFQQKEIKLTTENLRFNKKIFIVTVWFWELFMLPLFLLVLIAWNYFHLSAKKTNFNQDLVNMSMCDDEEEDEKESAKKGLMDKIHMVQEVVLVVQNVLDEIGNIGERIKNIFNWSVPFLSCLTFLMLFASTLLLYCIPLRYIVLTWGVYKFTKKLRNPYSVDNNGIVEFLKRVPSDVQKVQYNLLKAPSNQGHPRRKK